MDSDDARRMISRTRDRVRERMGLQGAGHGWDHVERVVSNALVISADVGGDRFVIELAALLHDIGDAKFHDGRERSGEFSRQILLEFGGETDVIEHVTHIVDNLSFRRRHDARPLSLEGKIVQDADRLDALGAIGIVRTIEYGHSAGRAFYSSEDVPTTFDHFHEKLLRLSESMNTEIGKRLAKEREQFMVEFLERYQAEQRIG